jgi:hypothetical protein
MINRIISLVIRAVRTNAHNHQETSEESSKINHCIAAILHEIIGAGASSAYPVRQWGKDVGRSD